MDRVRVDSLTTLACQRKVELIGANGADAWYPLMSAASIIATAKQDQAINGLQKRCGDFSWGFSLAAKIKRYGKE